MRSNDIAQVYWIFNASCTTIETTGYVGVSKDACARFKAHVRNKRVPNDSQYIIVFEGTRSECFEYEFKLRPAKNTGWNNAIGGSQGYRVGFSHTEHAKKKMSLRSLGRKQTAEHIAKRISVTSGQKRPKQSASMTGHKNPMYGKKRPQYVIEAVRKAHLGKPSPIRQEIYCVECHDRACNSVLKKYHNKCFRMFAKRATEQPSSTKDILV